jgi:predicted acylesterase/phospholipase RssA
VIERREFLYALGLAGLAPTLLGSNRDEATPEPLERALVLSGGGARGAYQAGIVGALAAIANVRDGSPLLPYEVVCGTSIGALNGWCVATGQYRKLHDLWYGISAEHLLRAKPQYAALRDPQSGVVERVVSAVSLVGLTRDQNAVLQNDPVYRWIEHNLDPAIPLLMPLVWAATNLSRQRPEYFYLLPPNARQDLPDRVVRALQLQLGPFTIVRKATPDLLHRAIFASTAIPLAFAPVLIPNPDGEIDEYCDGGVASNSPVGIAHAVANAADVVLMDPPFEAKGEYEDAVEVGMAVFGTMQRKILEVEMRNTYFQSLGKRALLRLDPRQLAQAMQNDKIIARLVQTVPVTDLRYIRPDTELPVSVVGFGDEVGIGKAYRVGWEDAVTGFTPYNWETFRL